MLEFTIENVTASVQHAEKQTLEQLYNHGSVDALRTFNKALKAASAALEFARDAHNNAVNLNVIGERTDEELALFANQWIKANKVHLRAASELDFEERLYCCQSTVAYLFDGTCDCEAQRDFVKNFSWLTSDFASRHPEYEAWVGVYTLGENYVFETPSNIEHLVELKKLLHACTSLDFGDNLYQVDFVRAVAAQYCA